MTVLNLQAKRNEVLRARGIPGFVPAPPVAEHLRSLLAAGWTRGRIADRAGVDRRTVHGLLKAERPTVQRVTARRLLALRTGPGDPKVSAVGSMRRLRALARQRWPLTIQAAAAGISHPYARDIASGRATRVSRPVADAIAVMFEEHCLRLGPMASIATRAAANGWPPPLAWDDIDDPAERPKGIATPCKSPWCDNPALARGVCARCYYRRHRSAAGRAA